MTAKDAPHDGAARRDPAADLDLDNIVSLSADGCARPGGKSNYTPPPARKFADSGIDGLDDVGSGPLPVGVAAAATAASGKARAKFKDTGFDGYDDDAKGPATIDLISRMRGDDDEFDDDPAA